MGGLEHTCCDVWKMRPQVARGRRAEGLTPCLKTKQTPNTNHSISFSPSLLWNYHFYFLCRSASDTLDYFQILWWEDHTQMTHSQKEYLSIRPLTYFCQQTSKAIHSKRTVSGTCRRNWQSCVEVSLCSDLPVKGGLESFGLYPCVYAFLF